MASMEGPPHFRSANATIQQIGGNITIGKKTQPVLGAMLSGDKLSFRYLDNAGTLHSVKATVKGNGLEGEAQGGSLFNNIKGTRR